MPSLISNIWHLQKVWQSMARASLVREMGFRGNFIAGLVRQALWLAAFVLVIDILFQHTSSLAGWKKEEILLLVGLSRLFEGFSDLIFTRNLIGEFPDTVNNGKFDFTLTKPIPAQFNAAFSRLHIANIGNVLAGLTLIMFALNEITAPISTSAVLFFGLLIAVGVVVRYAILVILASLTFVLERFNAMWAIDVLLTEPLTYPFDVFPRGSRIALTYFLPLAFMVFIPAQALTGRLNVWLVPIGIGLATISLIIANLAWRAGLRRYSSASS